MQSHRLPDKASLSKIRKLIRADLVRVGATPSVVFDCLVAVTEACADALERSGSRRGPDPRISWTIERQSAQFCIEEFAEQALQANGTETSDLPKRRLSDVLQSEGLDVLGDQVIENLMDRVEVEENGKSKQTTLFKRLR